MQEIFGGDESALKAFRRTLSDARFARYLNDKDGDDKAAVRLYLWNTRLSQSLYLPLQTWEVALRNKLNGFLAWRYGAAWPYNPRTERELSAYDARRLAEARQRQEQNRGVKPATAGDVVADLSAGFWVALLSRSYEVTFSWRYNLGRFVFPAEPKLSRLEAYDLNFQISDLRNRIAHYEPIYHLQLDVYRADLDRLLQGMCPATNAYARAVCTFEEVWDAPA